MFLKELKAKFLLLVLVAPCCLYCCCLAAPQIARSSSSGSPPRIFDGENCIREYDTDYLTLNLQWGPGACATGEINCIHQPKQEFTIHGLWPNKYNVEMANCCGSKYNRAANAKYKSQLQSDWISLSGESDSFHSYQWTKHGTCGLKTPGIEAQDRYFATTLRLFKSLPIESSLVAAGIQPSSDTAYDSLKIINALRSATGGTRVKLSCKDASGRSAPSLTSVSVCYDKNIRPMDCPPSAKKCLSKLYIERALRTSGGFVTSRSQHALQRSMSAPSVLVSNPKPVSQGIKPAPSKPAWTNGSPFVKQKEQAPASSALDISSSEQFPSLG